MLARAVSLKGLHDLMTLSWEAMGGAASGKLLGLAVAMAMTL
jgi:hypothetical protein